jgi:hypothetical protein
MLYWNTVSPALNEALIKLMHAQALKDFRLVGGTALSLQLGHRMSIDIDLFTDAAYGTINFNSIEDFLKNEFRYAQGDFDTPAGIGKSYSTGDDVDSLLKLDIYYSMDPFFQPFMQADNIRLATVEEVIAMKVDVIQRGGRKKDFWDIHELMNKYAIDEMIDLHKQRFEWTHNRELIIKNFTDFQLADDDFDPLCLKNKEWIYIKEDIRDAAKHLSKL